MKKRKYKTLDDATTHEEMLCDERDIATSGVARPKNEERTEI